MTIASSVVLLSGGLDSAVALALVRAEGRACHALTVDYGQRHRVELESARRVASVLGCVSHRVVALDFRAIGGSALTDASIGVPAASDRPGVPLTYVPARNATMLAIAAGLAEVVGAGEIVIGANVVDYSGYPDCREPFLRAMESALALGTRAGTEGGAPVRIRAPLMSMSKAEIIVLGHRLGVDLSMTSSCYDPDVRGRACGRCDACAIRRRGFADAGVPDPTRYGAGEAVRP